MYVHRTNRDSRSVPVPVHPVYSQQTPPKDVTAYIWFWIVLSIACLIIILIGIRMWLQMRKKHEHGCRCCHCRPRPHQHWTHCNTEPNKSNMDDTPNARKELLSVDEETAELLTSPEETPVSEVKEPRRLIGFICEMDQPPPNTNSPPNEVFESKSRRSSTPETLDNQEKHLEDKDLLDKNETTPEETIKNLQDQGQLEESSLKRSNSSQNQSDHEMECLTSQEIHVDVLEKTLDNQTKVGGDDLLKDETK